MNKTIAILVVIATIPITPVLAVETTAILQNGLSGYAGTRDTFVSSEDWATPPQYSLNYGVSDIVALSRDSGDNPLIFFDLSSIPANSAISSVQLELYNLTASSSSGTQDLLRRVRAFEVLVPWDEGNLDGQQIDSTGDHGATGDFAFSYFSGEGTNIAWSSRGMVEGIDFASSPESFSDVVNEGWYTWDLTSLARTWIRGETNNQGIVLRDATGYEDDNVDGRDFVSCQASSNTSLRPILRIVYNPDTPSANAGPDQEDLSWAGGAIVLDGSLSTDRPGGNDTTLQYSWAIITAAYGSQLSGNIGQDKITSFSPDRPGEWEFELTLTNELAEASTDRVKIRLLSLSAAHPRIYLTPAKLAILQSRATAGNPRWVQLETEANQPDGSMHAKALVSKVKAQASYCNEAIIDALALAADANEYSTKAGDIALVYDWCHDELSSGDASSLLVYMENWAANPIKPEDFSGWGNYWPRYNYSWVVVGLAAYGDHASAQEWFDRFRHDRHGAIDIDLLNKISAGGAWPEGMIYDWIANGARLKAIEAWRSATSEDLFASSPWFEERLPYILLHRWPGTAEEWGHIYHPYRSTGDTERNRGSMANYERIEALILIERFPNNPVTPQLQHYLATPPADQSMDFVVHDEFLWFNPDQTGSEPNLLSHFASGTGSLMLRSSWPSGAADTDPNTTLMSFQCGDHFTYHQHYDQNSFTLFKGNDLLIDSGVYSGDGLSDHDVNYYVRTIAHNTLVVYNPSEDFSTSRPDATSNDGGQRSPTPGSRSPSTMEYFDQHAVHYETGNIVRFADNEFFTYALGDATAAYNNPTYYQAMDTAFDSNTAKVSRFEREFLYLRPTSENQLDFVVIYDRVGVVSPAFSGPQTKLLFHTLAEPTVQGSGSVISPGETLYADAASASATSGTSTVHINFLSPWSHNIRKVGGSAEKAFWVFGNNYDWHWAAGEPYPRPTNDFEDTPYGEWRLELEPADSGLEHNFLTVIQPRLGGETVAVITHIDGNLVEGAHMSGIALSRVALFSKAFDGTPPVGTITYLYPGNGPTLNVVFDLSAGAQYNLSAGTQGSNRTIMLSPSGAGQLITNGQGVLSFTMDAGDLIFADGFESGSTNAWSGIVP